MNGPTWTNIAGDNASVGVQAAVIHGGVDYYASGDTPEQTYRLGLHHLGVGNAERARELIGDAVGHGYVSSEVVFHWALALLSGRVLDQLSEADLASLNDAFGRCVDDGDWARGLRLIRQFFDYSVDVSINGTNVAVTSDDLDTLTKEFEALPEAQRALIRRHMDLLLDGAIEDRLHAQDHDELPATRMANGRADRAWKFFHPEPAPPRFRQPRDAPLTLPGLVQLVASATAAASGLIWLLVVLAGRPSIAGVVACLAALSGGLLCARFGTQSIRIRDERRAHDVRYRYLPPISRQRVGGFAGAVSRMFDQYSYRYAPSGPAGQVWLMEIAGVRQWLRDELVEVYRESRIPAAAVAWLVRHRVSDVKRRWLNGTLWEYQTRLRVPFETGLTAISGAVMTFAGFLWLAGIAISIQALPGFVAMLLTLGGGIPATRIALTMDRGRWRYQAELAEVTALREADYAAYQRWCAKLADRRPADAEMATWLDADRRWLKHEAMRIHGLAPRDVIAHTFLDGPARSCKRARTSSGPMRYSRYVLRVYLLTAAGVRQVNADLDFQTGELKLDRRMSFRYDAVASVEVTPSSRGQHKVRLMLVNREPVDVKLTDDDTMDQAEIEDPNVLQRTLQTSGLDSTLRILEGIAAEGKEWVEHHASRRTVARLRMARESE